MSRSIEAEKLKSAIRKAFPNLEMRIEINSIINEQPTADVVEVVRCKDCKHQRFYSKDNESFYCKELVTIEMHMSDGDGEFYCSYGERREEIDGCD